MNKGNMYDWVHTTRNFIGGPCPHKCRYCYVNALKKRLPHVKKRYTGKLRLLKEELAKSEGKNKWIFVQSCSDLCAQEIRDEWIELILAHCQIFPLNQYLFQSKNPGRFLDFQDEFPGGSILGTTIETNRSNNYSLAPPAWERVEAMQQLSGTFDTMLSLEPVMDFDVPEILAWIKQIRPKFVSIGADSKGHGLPEPPAYKLCLLIKRLKLEGIEVKLKKNLDRLLKEK